MLRHVQGGKSFDDVRFVNGVQYSTNFEACKALGLIFDNYEYANCLRVMRQYRFAK